MATQAVEKVVSEFKQLSAEDQKEALQLFKQKLNGTAQHAPSPASARMTRDRSREYAWLDQHRAEYIDQWVALDGDRLLGHGPTINHAERAAKAQGVEDALLILIETPDGSYIPGRGPRIVAVNVATRDTSLEDEWLRQHQHEYPGEWLALYEDRLISHSPILREVTEETKRQGINSPYFIRVDSPDDLPWAGF